MAKVATKALNMNIKSELLERVDRYRFKRMYPTRSEAIEALLEAGLRANPERVESKKQKLKADGTD